MYLLERPALASVLLLIAFASTARAAPPRVLDPGDATVRDVVERLVDEGVINVPLLSWPIAHAELRRAIALARGAGLVDAAHEPLVARLEASLDGPSRAWSIAAGDPTDLRQFADTPRASGELGLRIDWNPSGRVGTRLALRTVADPVDGQALRPDGTTATLRAGNWLASAGWQDRWWGGGHDGSLQLSTNARPVFSLSLDREMSTPFTNRWLSWLGPWTFGTFFGALEQRREDSNHALLWGMRVAARPLPGLEISITRNAQFCGDKPPCGLGAFWDVFSGNDNVGESISATDEPGNQLATYELRWAGRIGERPLSFYLQRTGETIDNKFPRPLRSLNLLSVGTWGTTPAGDRWRTRVELSSTICADLDSAVRTPDCGYENGLFTGGYRYRGRVIGHSSESDTRQAVVGLLLDTPRRTWGARLLWADVNRIGAVPQRNQLLSTGPSEWWFAEGSLRQPLGAGALEVALGLERREDALSRDTSTEPRGFLRWTQSF